MNNFVEMSHIIIIQEAWNALTEFKYSNRWSAWEVIFRASKGLTLIVESIWMTTWKWPHHTHYLIEISLETTASFLYIGRILGKTALFLQDHWQTCSSCAAGVQNQLHFLSQRFSRSNRFSDTRTRNGTIHSLRFLPRCPKMPKNTTWWQLFIIKWHFSIMIFQYTAKQISLH